MVRIHSVQHPLSPSTAKKTKNSRANASDSDFSDYMTTESASHNSAASQPQAISSINATNPLLGLQEISDEEWQTRQAVSQGFQLLDELEELRMALLRGQVSLDTLKKIEKQVQQERSKTNNQHIQAILDDIELRAAVELAKLEVVSGKV